MGLPRGRTNNIKGRPIGSQGENAKELREIVSTLVSNNIDRLQEDIDSLEPKDRLFFLEKLLHYTLPKLQATSIHTTDETDKKPVPEWLFSAQ